MGNVAILTNVLQDAANGEEVAGGSVVHPLQRQSFQARVGFDGSGEFVVGDVIVVVVAIFFAGASFRFDGEAGQVGVRGRFVGGGEGR